MRGVAAILVMVFHLADVLAPLGWIAVDFFFLMSGFVIAHAYEARLRTGMGFAAFMKARAIRLYPVFALGLLFSAATVAIHGKVAPEHVAATLVRSALFVPTPAANTEPVPFLFPLNVVYWSLLFEALANVVYALCAKRLSTRVLAGFVAVSALGVVGWTFSTGTLHAGYSAENFAGGLPRAAFGFSAGVLVYRLHRKGAFRRVQGAPPAAALVALVGLALIREDPIVEVLLALFGLPALLVATVEARAPAGSARVLQTLGDLSYPLYALHLPIIWIAAALVSRYALEVWLMLFAPLVCLVAAIAAHRLFDAPVRRFLRARFGPRAEVVVAAA